MQTIYLLDRGKLSPIKVYYCSSMEKLFQIICQSNEVDEEKLGKPNDDRLNKK